MRRRHNPEFLLVTLLFAQEPLRASFAPGRQGRAIFHFPLPDPIFAAPMRLAVPAGAHFPPAVRQAPAKGFPHRHQVDPAYPLIKITIYPSLLATGAICPTELRIRGPMSFSRFLARCPLSLGETGHPAVPHWKMRQSLRHCAVYLQFSSLYGIFPKGNFAGDRYCPFYFLISVPDIK